MLPPRHQHVGQRRWQLQGRPLCTHSELRSSAEDLEWELSGLVEQCLGCLCPPPACLEAQGPCVQSVPHLSEKQMWVSSGVG